MSLARRQSLWDLKFRPGLAVHGLVSPAEDGKNLEENNR